MTIHSVTAMWSRAAGSKNMDDQQKVTSAFSGGYHVTHSIDATEDEKIAALPIKLGDPVVGMTYASYNSIGPSQPVGPTLSVIPWSATGQGDADGNDDPINALPEILYQSVSTQAETLIDAYGFPLVNTAGTPVRGQQATVFDMELSVKRNFLAVNGPLANQYLKSVNSDIFSVFGDNWQPGQASLVFYSAKPMYIGRVTTPVYYEVNARIQFRDPYNTTADKAWWLRYPSMGLQQRGLEVTISGGGGTGAAAYAVTNSDKEIIAVVVTAPGKGYTTAPTVSVSGGSGAMFTITRNNDRGSIESITVDNGGSNYVSKLIDCIDDNKKPVTAPVPLNASGVQGSESYIIERPEKPYLLPYNALGLI